MRLTRSYCQNRDCDNIAHPRSRFCIERLRTGKCPPKPAKEEEE